MRELKIGILSRLPDSYSCKRLVEEGTKRGHKVEIFDPLKCYMNISANNPSVHYMERELINFDAIIPRVATSVTFYGTAVLRQFEMGGTFSVNPSGAILKSRDKLRAHQILARKGIGMPVTGFAHSTEKIDDMIGLCGGAPLVIKLLEGSQGKGVVLAETKKAAESVMEAFKSLNAYFLVQEFIKEAGGADIRCFVVGDKVVASMKRQAKEGEFRSNLHSGGYAEKIKITPEERKTAVLAAKTLGLKVAGVDILRSNDGPKVMEVNSSPGLEGIETSTGINVAAKIFEYIESLELKVHHSDKQRC
ncbi:30S ribosomal protein S6--L-glutamate ligase [Halobacteriovorax sp. GB3]|uniref:30S ribosomal protein S6--L-glutamate ligase n=1 Tax=Halobacteriovorax sp. GB3 TaxID=2719615 RepID=UPI00235F291B|nr:30S ribosomal protein S6--L-glutamate ligase [Halobacteriovorax sp. GB3]MDD0853569.1 30S ribosomal protein S6--L-glutamate ligase [Halobacteriovorax sp. GB3]